MRLTWAKEKKNWTVAQWSKVLFSDESKFCILFRNQDPRVWRKGGHSPSCLKSSVKFPQSVMIWGAMSSAGVGQVTFIYITLFYIALKFSLNSICAIKSVISLEIKCPQQSKPEATMARNQNSIGDRMEKKTLRETRPRLSRCPGLH